MKYLWITLHDATRFFIRVTGESERFVRGIEVDRSGEEIATHHVHQRLRIIEKTAIKKQVELRMNNHYAELEIVS